MKKKDIIEPAPIKDIFQKLTIEDLDIKGKRVFIRADFNVPLDENLMIRALPGVFCAGEMLDWEAPTGGYLLTACFSTGRAAGQGVLKKFRP